MNHSAIQPGAFGRNSVNTERSIRLELYREWGARTTVERGDDGSVGPSYSSVLGCCDWKLTYLGFPVHCNKPFQTSKLQNQQSPHPPTDYPVSSRLTPSIRLTHSVTRAPFPQTSFTFQGISLSPCTTILINPFAFLASGRIVTLYCGLIMCDGLPG